MDNRVKAILYQRPERIPVSVSLLPATWALYGRELQALRSRHPAIFGAVNAEDEVKYFTPPTYHAGKHVDAWGCVWENVSEGYEAIVTGHPVKTREDIHTLRIPEKDIGLPHGFMFLRLTDLRGFEEMMIDFAEEPPELQILIDKVLEYNLRQVRLAVLKHEGTVMYFGDDNGMQHALPISPAKWRQYIKPCYAAIYKIARDAGKIVYMHTDGCIYEVIPDMIACGVQCLNPQIRANGLDQLERTCKGKVAINLDLDRQLFPFASPAQVREHIIECARRMYLPEGGLLLHAECAADVPLENIEAICTTLEECSAYHGLR